MSEKKKSVYASIADDILMKIQQDIYPQDSLLPPERELMEIYSVQRTTVRRGLEILSSMGYIKKAAGLGSIVQRKEPSHENGIEILPAVKHTSLQNDSPLNYAVLLPQGASYKNLDNLPKLVVDLIVSFNKQGIGFITTNFSSIEKNSRIIALESPVIPETQSPICFALSQSDDYRSVVLDNDKSAYTALTYLENLGHTQIAFIGTNSGFSFENSTYDSFCAVNSFLNEELVMLSGSDEKSGFECFSELFRRHGKKFTAVCTANDEIAKGVIKAAKYYKLSVPDELSVISLCSSQKQSDFDRVLYDTDSLSDEILDSISNYKRIATVLFSGNLKISGSCAEVKSKDTSKGNMSDFLL